MRFHLLATALALGATVMPSIAAAADDAAPMAPSTPWSLNYDTDSCVLQRMFGEGDRQVFLEMRRFQPGTSLQVIVGSNWMTVRRKPVISYRFGSNDATEGDRIHTTLDMNLGFTGILFITPIFTVPGLEEIEDPDARDAFLRTLDLRQLEQEAAAKTDRLWLEGAFPQPIELDLGPLDGALGAMNTCIDELLTHWDIDVEAHRRLTRPATPIDRRKAARMIDYPPAMVREELNGVVNIRLAIDERGLITGCHIQMPLSDPQFEESSCADIEHAFEFEPALDENGQPIASYWTANLVFFLR